MKNLRVESLNSRRSVRAERHWGSMLLCCTWIRWRRVERGPCFHSEQGVSHAGDPGHICIKGFQSSSSLSCLIEFSHTCFRAVGWWSDHRGHMLTPGENRVKDQETSLFRSLRFLSECQKFDLKCNRWSVKPRLVYLWCAALFWSVQTSQLFWDQLCLLSSGSKLNLEKQLSVFMLHGSETNSSSQFF